MWWIRNAEHITPQALAYFKKFDNVAINLFIGRGELMD